MNGGRPRLWGCALKVACRYWAVTRGGPWSDQASRRPGATIRDAFRSRGNAMRLVLFAALGLLAIGLPKGHASEIVGLSGKCLDVDGGRTTNGAVVDLWPCVSSYPNQRWNFVGEAIVGIGGKCLDVSGGRAVDGARVQMWDCNNGPNQSWRFFSDGRIVALAVSASMSRAAARTTAPAFCCGIVTAARTSAGGFCRRSSTADAEGWAAERPRSATSAGSCVGHGLPPLCHPRPRPEDLRHAKVFRSRAMCVSRPVLGSSPRKTGWAFSAR